MSSKELVSDELWHIIKPLLPPEPYKARCGRPRRVVERTLA
jgi:transposase